MSSFLFRCCFFAATVNQLVNLFYIYSPRTRFSLDSYVNNPLMKIKLGDCIKDATKLKLPDSHCFVLLFLLLALETYFRFFIKFKSKRWRTMTLSPMTLCTLQQLRNLSWSLQISRQGNPTPKAKRSTK